MLHTCSMHMAKNMKPLPVDMSMPPLSNSFINIQNAPPPPTYAKNR